ncbi:hypothetical protein Godav_007163 [Gossypium davidsonii]|uniref:PPPDE domain-containing protein n=2 Tax=Gossypium TaxID=3633 RepID=A0A7J8S658_GOSDV|nr:hypothetical protein [Gossypium davidsonii]
MRLFPSNSSVKKRQINGGSNGALLYLNVYDLTPMNNYLFWFGLGIFHSGIEVYGLEYGYGAHEYPTSGVFELEPRSCPGFIFRRSVLLGSTNMSRSEFRLFIEQLSQKYHGDTYHLITKNCNHFTDEVCLQLTGKPIPGWVNRLARLGEKTASFSRSCHPRRFVIPKYFSRWLLVAVDCIFIQRGVLGYVTVVCVLHGSMQLFYLINAVFEVSGSFCNCLLPESIQVTAVRHLPDNPAYSDDERLDSAAMSLTAESEEEEEDGVTDHHLLTIPNSNVAFLKEKTVWLTREL